MMKALAIALAGAVLAVAHVPATAQSVYTWKDEKGVVHFGDRPLDSSAVRRTVKPRLAGCLDAECHEREAMAARTRTRDAQHAVRAEQAFEQREREARRARELAKAREDAAKEQRLAQQRRCESQRRVGCDSDEGLRNMANDERQAQRRIVRSYR